MQDKNIRAKIMLSSGSWDTFQAVIQRLERRGFEEYELGRSRILISASLSQYQERLDIALKQEGDHYVPAKEIIVPEDLKPYVQSISFSSLRWF